MFALEFIAKPGLETKMSSNYNLTFGAKWTITSPAFLRLGQATSSLKFQVDQYFFGPLHATFSC